jgi:hypothetical protein
LAVGLGLGGTFALNLPAQKRSRPPAHLTRPTAQNATAPTQN